MEVEVDQRDLGPAGRERHREIGRQDGLAAAALGAEDGDDLAGQLAGCVGSGAASTGEPASQRAGQLDGPRGRGADRGGVAGRRQDVPDAEPERRAQQLAGILLAQQHDWDLRRRLLQPFREPERLVVGESRAGDGGEHLAALGRHRGHRLVGAGGAQQALVEAGEGVRDPCGGGFQGLDDDDRHGALPVVPRR
jgi:hypothetical protein